MISDLIEHQPTEIPISRLSDKFKSWGPIYWHTTLYSPACIFGHYLALFQVPRTSQPALAPRGTKSHTKKKLIRAPPSLGLASPILSQLEVNTTFQ